MPDHLPRTLALIWAGLSLLGAVVAATLELLRDRQHTRAVRDHLRYLDQTGV